MTEAFRYAARTSFLTAGARAATAQLAGGFKLHESDINNRMYELIY